MIEPTVQELRYVVAVADRKHFSEAARACFVSQPTLSQQIRKLEERLGLALFERSNKRVELTPAGEAFAAQARVALDELARLEEVAAGFRDPLAAALQTGIISSLSPYLLPWLLPALKRIHPALRLGVREGKTAELLAELRDHRLDAVLAALPLGEPSVSTKALFDEPFWLLCPASHRLAGRKRVLDSDLDPGELLLLEEGHCLRDQSLDICGTSAATQDTAFRATSLETLQELVAAGEGCTLIPALALTKNRLRSAQTVAIPFRSRRAHRRIGIVWRKSFPRVEVVRALADVIRGSAPDAVRPAG